MVSKKFDARVLPPDESDNLIRILEQRWTHLGKEHQGFAELAKELPWSLVEARLKAHPEKLWSLIQMEETGGEPCVTGWDQSSGAITFTDCSRETPAGRRNLCYDQEAREGRKKNKPEGSAAEMAESMGIQLLTEEQYQALQKLGSFDTKTSSWLQTPEPVRRLGGAIFGDRRYDRVFVYHNGADSYYGVRGFRGWIRI